MMRVMRLGGNVQRVFLCMYMLQPALAFAFAVAVAVAVGWRECVEQCTSGWEGVGDENWECGVVGTWVTRS